VVRPASRIAFPRSTKGIRNSTRIPSVGRTTVPTISNGPSKSLSVWNRRRKYHSGRGTNVVSVGSANCPNGTRTATANIASTTKIRDGIEACSALSREGIRVNVTLCFSPAQALLAAKAGAYFVSPFVGRLDDRGATGIDLIRQIVAIYENYDFETQVLAASLRGALHVVDAALAGAHIGTLPFKVLDSLFNHPLNDKGLEQFLKDYNKVFATT
jgi:hypothetical protein